MPIPEYLQEINLAKQKVASFLTKCRSSIAKYIGNNHDISHSISDASGEFNTTCTAFCIYYLSIANMIKDHSEDLQVTSKPIIIESKLQQMFDGLVEGFVKEHRDKKVTDVGELPNQYNSSIQFAGCQRLAKTFKNDISSHDEYTLVLKHINEKIHENGGWISRIAEPKTPSAYLTFWAFLALSAL